MDRNYLLTYRGKEGVAFDWFETEEEMNQFIERNKVHVIEAWKINDAELLS